MTGQFLKDIVAAIIDLFRFIGTTISLIFYLTIFIVIPISVVISSLAILIN